MRATVTSQRITESWWSATAKAGETFAHGVGMSRKEAERKAIDALRVSVAPSGDRIQKMTREVEL